MEKYGRKHWKVIQNLWLDQYVIYESDIVLLTNLRSYVFEVKNYDGTFEYKNNRCFINGNRLKENCIQQAEKALMNLQEICGSIDRSMTAKGALLMVGEHNEVQLHSEVDGIEVATRYQLRDLIRRIAKEEATHYHITYDSQALLDHFEKIAILNPFGPLKSYTPEEVLKGTRGIYCKEYGTYEVESSRKFIKCSNNHEELRLEAIIRTIHEFGVLTFDSDFMKQSVLRNFMKHQLSKPYLVVY